MIIDFFKTQCQHTKIPVDTDYAYCPDCGELIKNEWYLIRCSCCNIKRTAHFEYKKIKPDTKYCPNCGSTEFYIQKLDKISFIDVPYTVLVKEVVKQINNETHQIWIEKDCEQLSEGKMLRLPSL